MGCGASSKRAITATEALARFETSLQEDSVENVFKATLLLIDTQAVPDEEHKNSGALLLMRDVLQGKVSNDANDYIKAATFLSADKAFYTENINTMELLEGRTVSDLQPVLNDPFTSEMIKPVVIKLLGRSVQESDVKQTLRSTQILQRLTAKPPADLTFEQETAGLLLMQSAFGEEYRDQAQPLVEAAQFYSADKDVYAAKLEITSLEDARIKQLLNLPIPIIASIFLPEISKRLSAAVEAKDVSRVLLCTDCLRAGKASVDFKQEAAALLLMFAAMSEAGQEQTCAEAAKFHREDESMYVAKLDTTSIEDARIKELVNISMFSTILAPDVSRRLQSSVEKGDVEGTFTWLQQAQKISAVLEEGIRKAAVILIMRGAIEDTSLPGEQYKELATSLCNDKQVYIEAMPEHQAHIEELMSAMWQISPSGDSMAGDWTDLPAAVSSAFEGVFNKRQRGEEESSKISVTVDSTIYNLDLDFMTVLATTHDKTDLIKPLRKVDSAGLQLHPDPGDRHPWYWRRIEIQEAKGGDGDWLTNEFFFETFCEAMRSSGHKVVSEAEEIFDFRFNQDFRAFAKDSKSEVFTRGGEKYSVPVGWKKFAVRVKGKYDDGDDSWLGLDGGPGEWAVAYHGTKHNCLPGILENGFFAGSRQVFAGEKAIGGGFMGSGVYCSPNIDDVAAHENYATSKVTKGHSAQFVFQCRARPGAIKKLDKQGLSGLGTPWDEIWVVNDPKDIRPYAILVRGSKADYRPPTIGHFTNEPTS